MPSFEVKGRGKETNRARKRVYSAFDEDEAITKAETDGIIVESCNILPEPKPTEAQLAYAKDLGISVPQNATLNEVSDMISCRVEYDKPATERHKSFARLYRVECTDYVGKRKLFNMIFESLQEPSRINDMVSWFVFRVYRELVHGADNTPIQSPNDPTIKEITNELVNDSSVIKSIKRYKGRDLIWFGEWTAPDGSVHTGGSNRTTAYQRASSLLREKLKLSSKTSRSLQLNSTRFSSVLTSSRKFGSSGKSFLRIFIKVLILAGILAFIFWLIK